MAKKTKASVLAEEITARIVANMGQHPGHALSYLFNAGFLIGVGNRGWPRGLKAGDIEGARAALIEAYQKIGEEQR